MDDHPSTSVELITCGRDKFVVCFNEIISQLEDICLELSVGSKVSWTVSLPLHSLLLPSRFCAAPADVLVEKQGRTCDTKIVQHSNFTLT